MVNNKRQFVWWPFIVAACIALGIFIGNRYLLLSQAGGRMLGSGNKLNTILDIIEEQYVDTVNMPDLIEHVIPNVFSELDPHSNYIPANEVERRNEDLEGSFSGIGVSFNMQLDTVLVIEVVPGGPSEKAGILPFDRIVTINDTVYAGIKANQEKVMKLLRGMKNTTVRLGIKRDGNPDLIEVQVTRGDVPVNTVDVAYKVAEGVGYIKVSKFGRTTYNEFITAIAHLKQEKCHSFIIDLRGNTGGYMEAAINMTNEFMPEGRMIVYAYGKNFPRFESHANGTGTCLESPLVVLTDEISASASEIFSGAIQDNDRGLIIGRRTFGKGLVQSPIKLRDGSEVLLTVARYYTPSGRCIQKQYKMGELEDYDQDIYNRYLHGEFDSADSIKQIDSLQYQTVGGRIVYGGGGIMPDIFIPRDTSGVTSYFSSIVNSGVLYMYALEYSDQHRKQFAAYENYEELWAYLKTQPLVNDFANYAMRKGVKKRPALIAISRQLIEAQLQAYIIRNFFKDAGFYPVFQQDDITLKKAVEVLTDGKPLMEHI